MKSAPIIVIVLCLFATSCIREDTRTANLGRRTIEPWLTGVTEWQKCTRKLRDGRVVAEATCGPAAVAPTAATCTAPVTTHAQALSAFSAQPACLDSAIATLEGFAPGVPGARSDLSALYYVRAQRDDDPADLLRALEASRQASAATPSSPRLLFNRALILESLGLPSDSIATWNEFLTREKDQDRAEEARAHRQRLQAQRGDDATSQWDVRRSRLAGVLKQQDLITAQQLIERFPASAQAYFEEEVLAQWGEHPTPENLAAAKTLAVALSNRLNGDPCNLEMVKAMERAMQSPETRSALATGHALFRQARSAEKSRRWADAHALYRRAEALLPTSPLRLYAGLGAAVSRSFAKDGENDALQLLHQLQPAAERGHYVHLLARIVTTRAFLLIPSGRHVEALAESELALKQYQRLRDEENILSLESRRIGYLSIVGLRERALRNAVVQSQRNHRIVALRDRHFLLGEIGGVVAEAGHPHAALRYRDEAVELIRRTIAATPSRDEVSLKRNRYNLAVALRARAAIELGIGNQTAARRDLDELKTLIDPAEEDDLNLRAFQTRLHEVEGQAWMPNRPDRAILSFSRALADGGDAEIPTFRARVRVRRAEAYARLQRPGDAGRDLDEALLELREEEKLALAKRKRGESEQIWSNYFARSQETYRLLIRYYADQDLPTDAFDVAERSRAFEPLDLIRRLDSLPGAFRDLTTDGNAVPLPDIRRLLPPGTFLIQYSVHEDRTYAWVISREGFRALRLPASAADVANWTNAVQGAARKKEERLFDNALTEPYASLISTPLLAIEGMPGGRRPDRRLVFVPDGAMHGLPIAALKDKKSNRHLIETATVEIAGSATLYVFSLLRKAQLSSQDRQGTALLIGAPDVDPQLAKTYDLDPLRGARLEVSRLRDIYAPQTAPLIGPNATVPAFLELAPRHSIVHVAAHAIANAKEPTKSMLFLAPSPDHKGALEAEELMKRLQPGRTRLVVLATCSSAGGVPVGPEGLAPLVRPFLTSGVPAVIGSLWEVNDATAEPLLVSFHRDYRQSGDAAVALQKAQRELLGKNKKAGRKSALAWAPFQVIGH